MDALALLPLVMALGKAGLSAGTTSTITTANALNYAINSKAYNKGAMTNQATPTTDAVTGTAFPALSAGQGTVIVLGLDASGAVKAMQGQIQALDASGAFVVAPQFAAIPDGVCPFAYIVLKAGATLVGTFTFGTSNLSGVSGMTYLFQDIIQLPSRPQVS